MNQRSTKPKPAAGMADRWFFNHRFRTQIATIAIFALLTACAGEGAGQSQERPADAIQSPKSLEYVEEEGVYEDLPAELNEPQRAAMVVATMGRPVEVWAESEIQLQAALFEAAWARRTDSANREAVLTAVQGVRRPAGEAARETQLRVLAAMERWAEEQNVQVRWAEGAAGTGERRLRAEIVGRDEAQATVWAEVGEDWSRDTGRSSWRIRVEAVWDGAAWRVRDDGLRMQW